MKRVKVRIFRIYGGFLQMLVSWTGLFIIDPIIRPPIRSNPRNYDLNERFHNALGFKSPVNIETNLN